MPEREWVTHHPDPVAREKVQRRWQELHSELQRLGAERMVLFGSLPKGTATPGSDIDLLAVIDGDLPFPERLSSEPNMIF